MSKPIIVLAITSLLGLAIGFTILTSRGKQNQIRTFAELRDNELGQLLVVGRDDGFADGWSVAFVHRTLGDQRFGYYLAHDSPAWNNVILKRESNIVAVIRNRTRVAEYDSSSGMFKNVLHGTTYRREDQANSGVGPKWWTSALE